MATLFSIVGCMICFLFIFFVGLFLYVEVSEWYLRRYCRKHLIVSAVDVIAKEAEDAKRANNTDAG